jgi:hypothetical protein
MLPLMSKNSWSVRRCATVAAPLALDLCYWQLGLPVVCSKYEHYIRSRNPLYNTFTQHTGYKG